MFIASLSPKRCCLLLVFCTFLLCGFKAKAQTNHVPRVVAKKWHIGTDTVIVHDDLRHAIAERVMRYDTVHIMHNIDIIALYIEWVRTYIASKNNAIPVEFAYLVLLDNELVKPLNEDKPWEANRSLWGLSDVTLAKLELSGEFHVTKYTDDKHDLVKTTDLMVNKFKEHNEFFRNPILTLLVFDYGYDKAKSRVATYFNSESSAYANVPNFMLDMNASIFIEFFALRYVIEHSLHKLKNMGDPQYSLSRQTFEDKQTLRHLARKNGLDIEKLFQFNSWMKESARRKSFENQHWIVPVKRTHKFDYPILPEKYTHEVIIPKTVLPSPVIKPIVLPQNISIKIENITDEIPLIHHIQPRETLFSIAKKYSTTVNLLKTLNPDVNPQKMKIGHPLLIKPSKIPKQHSADTTYVPVMENGDKKTRGDAPIIRKNAIKRIQTIQRIMQPAQQTQMRGLSALRTRAYNTKK